MPRQIFLKTEWVCEIGRGLSAVRRRVDRNRSEKSKHNSLKSSAAHEATVLLPVFIPNGGSRWLNLELMYSWKRLAEIASLQGVRPPSHLFSEYANKIFRVPSTWPQTSTWFEVKNAWSVIYTSSRSGTLKYETLCHLTDILRSTTVHMVTKIRWFFGDFTSPLRPSVRK